MTADTPPLDRARLDAVTDGDRDLQREVLGIFFAHVPGYVEAIRAARRHDIPWRSAVHRLKGAARSIGALPLATAAGEAELALPRLRTVRLTDLEQEIARLAAAVAGMEDLACALDSGPGRTGVCGADLGLPKSRSS